MEYKDFFEKALSGAEQKYPCSEIETALGNITERAKKSEQSSEPGQLHTASEPAHKPSNRFFPILGYTVGAAALIFGCVFGLKIVIENGGLKEGGPESADSNVTTAVTSEIPEITTVTSSDTTSANDNTDISQMLDTSMPENPFDLPPVGDYEGLEYYVESYVFRFDSLDSHIYDLVDRDELVEWINEHEQEKLKMGYGIEPLTVLAFVEKFGITKEQLTEAAKLMRDDKYAEDSALTDEDIDIIYSGDKKKIIEHFRAEYAVLGSDRAYSPMWLYEHTAEAYKAAGIDPRDILDILPAYEKMFRYNERNMNDEAWRAFRKKLTLYGDRAFYDESSVVKTYTFETDISEPFGDRAFEILENQFYGEWELVGSPYGLLPTISFTYSKDAFVHEGTPVTGIYETDEIYVIAFSNYGVSACYFIEKSDPNTMYYMSDLTSEFGITVVNCFKNNMQYTRSEGNSEAPELKTGEISFLGLKKLEHLYDTDFETFLEVTMESDGYDDIEGRGEYYLANVYNAGKPEWYLVDMSDSAVTLRVPYVTDRSGSEQTPVYLDLRFTKDDTGEWSVEYSSQSTDTSEENEEKNDEEPDWGITLSAKNITAEGLMLIISQCDGNYTGELEYGEPYSIEHRNGDKWETLEYLDGAVWHDLAYIVEPNTDKEIKLDWKWLYGTLSAGEYRIAKEFTDFRGTGNYDKQTIYVGFSITDDMTSKLGITLRTAQYNARKMTLQIVQNGGTSDGNIGTSLYRYTIERRENGKWQSYYNYTPQAGVPTLETGLKVKRNDVTEVKFDWRETAGSLPVGDYRLGMTFDCGDIKETKWLEFTIEESMTNELGISIEVMEVSKTGAKLGIDSKGADEQGFAYFDKDLYTLEKKNSSGKWKNVVSTVSTEMFTGKIAMCETGSAGMLETINWSGWCDKLSPGNYRISFKFYTGEGDSYKAVTLYAEFDITDDTSDKLTD